jgi:broad specificity phosphatase PhoE
MVVTALWLVRHGESLANLAASVAERGRHEVVAAPARDADVELSATGIQQATALGGWLGALANKPAFAFSSPYVRAEQTLLTAMTASGVTLPSGVDERLRDRELGILDLLTRWGVEKRYPDEAARKDWHGKFYYRPPGGESWADVALRVRSFLGDLDARGVDGDVLIVAHDAVVMVFLYVCLGMRERELLDFAQANPVLNASVTRLVRTHEGWSLEVFSSADHLEALGAPVTEHSGDPDVQPH